MNKVFKWLYNALKKNNERVFLREYHNSTKCPNCNKWSHEKWLDGQKDNVKLKSWGYTLRCGNCGSKSRWNTVAFPFPALCGKKGRLNKKPLAK